MLKLPFSPLLALLFTVGTCIYLHIGTLYTLRTLASSSCHDEQPHESLRSSFVKRPRRQFSSLSAESESVWWMEEEQDDWFERTYHQDNETYHAVRDLPNVKAHFNPICGHYRFNESALPTVTVIMPSQNEVSGWITTTVHSIIARTPPHLLKEVIVIDDNGLSREIRGSDVDEKEYGDLKKLPKVKVIHNQEREGCARSRLIGARRATGDVLMFVDSHVEMISSTWYQHLVLPIIENPKTMSIQTIDVIDDKGSREYTKVGTAYGFINDGFSFIWADDRFKEWDSKNTERPGKREPYETPFGPGSLFAMHRDEFWRLGGYDEGLFVWGSENIELCLKTWMCGGRVVMNPCSRVGHMFRKSKELKKKQWPPKVTPKLAEQAGCRFNSTSTSWTKRSDFDKILKRNNLRVMNIWVGDHPARDAYYKKEFGSVSLAPEWAQYVDELETDPAALKQIRLRKENQCRDFEWFDKQVIMKLLGRHHPWHKEETVVQDGKVSCGSHRATNCTLCPQGNGHFWCNGDCVWCEVKDQCMSPEELSKTCYREKEKEEEQAAYPMKKTTDVKVKQPKPFNDSHIDIVHSVKPVEINYANLAGDPKASPHPRVRGAKVEKNESMATFEMTEPTKPLDRARLDIVRSMQLVELKYVNVSGDFKQHPHRGAKDANDKWGYVHDETQLRRNPPNFQFDSIKQGCALRDSHYQLLAHKLVVDLKGHETAEKSGIKRDKLFCAIKSVSTKSHFLPSIRQTWGQKCDGFMAASNKTDPSLGTVNIPHEGDETYRNLWQKFRSLVSYLYDNYYEKYDWFYIGDDDTYVVVENLRLYLESGEIKLASNGGDVLPIGNETRQTPLLLGRRFAFNGDENDIFPSGGAGFVLNKAALKALVVSALPQFKTHTKAFTDDWFLGRALRKIGIQMYITQDEMGGERFMPLSPGRHYNDTGPEKLTGVYDAWYLNYSIDIKYGLDHCAEKSISFHYAELEEVKRFHAILYGLCPTTDK